jgi:hypothetical protein
MKGRKSEKRHLEHERYPRRSQEFVPTGIVADLSDSNDAPYQEKGDHVKNLSL